MKCNLHALALSLGLLATASTGAAEVVSVADGVFGKEVQPLVTEFCGKYHGERRPKAGINLSAFTITVSVYREPKGWQKVVAKLKAGEMPPEGKPQPAQDQREFLLAWVRNTLKDLDEGRFAADPGRVLIHRLSRTE